MTKRMPSDYVEAKWFKCVIRRDNVWALVEWKSLTTEDARLILRQLIRPDVKIANIEEV